MKRFLGGVLAAATLALQVLAWTAANAQTVYVDIAHVPGRGQLGIGQIISGANAGKFAILPLDANGVPEVDCVSGCSGGGGGGGGGTGGAVTESGTWSVGLTYNGSVVGPGNLLGVSDLALDALISGGKLTVNSALDGLITSGKLPVTDASLEIVVNSATYKLSTADLALDALISGGALTVSLPTGASTAANQATANTTLAAIFQALGSPLQQNGNVTATINGVGAISSTALETGHVLKSTNGTLFSYSVTNTGSSAGYVVVLANTTSIPANGSITPLECYQIQANNFFNHTENPPLTVSGGIVVAFTTGSCFSMASSSVAFVSGQVQ